MMWRRCGQFLMYLLFYSGNGVIKKYLGGLGDKVVVGRGTVLAVSGIVGAGYVVGFGELGVGLS